MEKICQGVDGRGIGFGLYRAQLRDVLKYQTSRIQTSNTRGEAKLQVSRVENLRPVLVESLNLPESLFTVTTDGYIISGHHRKAAAEQELGDEETSYSGDEPILICIRDFSSRSIEAQKATIDANNSASSSNIPKMMKSTLPVSEKVLKPILRAMKKANENKVLSESILERLTVKLAESISNDSELPTEGKKVRKEWASTLACGQALAGISGETLYSAKGGLAGKWATAESYSANFDLRSDSDSMTDLFVPFFELIDVMHEDDLWKTKVGNGTTLYYILFAMALRGELTKALNKRIVSNFKKSGSKVKALLKGSFLNNTADAEDSIIGILTE